MARKTKKQLEEEILQLKQDIHVLVMKKEHDFKEVAFVEIKWRCIFETENLYWYGTTNQIQT